MVDVALQLVDALKVGHRACDTCQVVLEEGKETSCEKTSKSWPRRQPLTCLAVVGRMRSAVGGRTSEDCRRGTRR